MDYRSCPVNPDVIPLGFQRMTQSRQRSHWWRYLLAGLVVSIVAVLGLLAYAARTALIAEKHYQAFLYTHAATLQFVSQTDGNWPASWNDLAESNPNSDFDWVSKCVTIDFSANPAEIAKQTPESFDAIRPNEPCFIIDDRVQHLIDTLREHH